MLKHHFPRHPISKQLIGPAQAQSKDNKRHSPCTSPGAHSDRTQPSEDDDRNNNEDASLCDGSPPPRWFHRTFGANFAEGALDWLRCAFWTHFSFWTDLWDSRCAREARATWPSEDGSHRLVRHTLRPSEDRAIHDVIGFENAIRHRTIDRVAWQNAHLPVGAARLRCPSLVAAIISFRARDRHLFSTTAVETFWTRHAGCYHVPCLILLH
mmetsp:Transcript_2502/g.5951  ORF Transcript_2502/g.5951 Transcript_2502/m.5951 type:complete len:211 (-) Transcript_2502:508-1140(-)